MEIVTKRIKHKKRNSTLAGPRWVILTGQSMNTMSTGWHIQILHQHSGPKSCRWFLKVDNTQNKLKQIYPLTLEKQTNLSLIDACRSMFLLF